MKKQLLIETFLKAILILLMAIIVTMTIYGIINLFLHPEDVQKYM